MPPATHTRFSDGSMRQFYSRRVDLPYKSKQGSSDTSLFSTLWSARLRVCLSSGTSKINHISKLQKISCTCCVWPWLDPPWMTAHYAMYFRFCGWRHVYSWAAGG